MKGVKRAVAFLVTVTVMLLLGVATAEPASAAPPSGSVTSDITSQLPSGYSGALTVTKFANQGGQLVASGTATVTDLATGATATQPFTAPVVQANGTCQILNLVLGPLDLDLLGLQVHLDRVVLRIDAQSGPGNLLGNLLCAVAGLLDGPNPLGALAGLLNRILALLGQ